MAKLSAGGRTEVVRMVRENPNPTYSDLITWEKVTVALMSDRKILVKRDVRFKSAGSWDTRNFHSYGWKVKATIHSLEPATVENWKNCYVKQGFKADL